MSIGVLLTMVREWYCPNCDLTQQTKGPIAEPLLHECPRLHILAPLVPVGTKAKVERHDRDDYVGKEIVRLDSEGRPTMSVTTERDDGQDTIVFAPTATARLGDLR